MNNTPEIQTNIGKVVKAKMRKLTAKWTVDSDMEVLSVVDEDALVKAMSDGIRKAILEDIMWPVPLRDAGIFAIL